LDPCLKINKQCTHKNRDKEPNQTGGQAIKSFDLRKTQKSRRAGKIEKTGGEMGTTKRTHDDVEIADIIL